MNQQELVQALEHVNRNERRRQARKNVLLVVFGIPLGVIGGLVLVALWRAVFLG